MWRQQRLRRWPAVQAVPHGRASVHTRRNLLRWLPRQSILRERQLRLHRTANRLWRRAVHPPQSGQRLLPCEPAMPREPARVHQRRALRSVPDEQSVRALQHVQHQHQHLHPACAGNSRRLQWTATLRRQRGLFHSGLRSHRFTRVRRVPRVSGLSVSRGGGQHHLPAERPVCRRHLPPWARPCMPTGGYAVRQQPAVHRRCLSVGHGRQWPGLWGISKLR